MCKVKGEGKCKEEAKDESNLNINLHLFADNC